MSKENPTLEEVTTELERMEKWANTQFVVLPESSEGQYIDALRKAKKRLEKEAEARNNQICEGCYHCDKYEKLLAAVTKHHSQKADDRCWMDDLDLYEAAGLPNHDRSVGDKIAMAINCGRFIEQRCIGGKWKSYAELEAECERYRKLIEAADFDKEEAGSGAVKYGEYDSEDETKYLPPERLPNIPDLEREIKKLKEAK